MPENNNTTHTNAETFLNTAGGQTETNIATDTDRGEQKRSSLKTKLALGVLFAAMNLAACSASEGQTQSTPIAAPPAAQPLEAPTIDQTAVQKAAEAILTQTAVAKPTETPQLTDTEAIAPTVTLEPTATATPTPEDTPTVEVEKKVDAEVLLRTEVVSPDGKIKVVTSITGDRSMHEKVPYLELDNPSVGGENGVLTRLMKKYDDIVLAGAMAAASSDSLAPDQLNKLHFLAVNRFGDASGANILNNASYHQMDTSQIGLAEVKEFGDTEVKGALTSENVIAFVKETEVNGSVETIEILASPNNSPNGGERQQKLEAFQKLGIARVETLIVVQDDEGLRKLIERYLTNVNGEFREFAFSGTDTIESAVQLAYAGKGTFSSDFSQAVEDGINRMDQEIFGSGIFKRPTTPQ